MTKLEIFNIALLGVGADLLALESDRNRNGDACRAYYPLAAKTILEKFPWSCALTRVSLVRMDEADPAYNVDLFDYEYQYALPEDCLRLWSIAGSTETPRIVNHRYLYTNAEDPVVEYIADISEPETQGGNLAFPPSLCDAIAWYMSYRMAVKIAPDANKNVLFSEFQLALDDAMNQDGLERTEDVGGEWNDPMWRIDPTEDWR